MAHVPSNTEVDKKEYDKYSKDKGKFVKDKKEAAKSK